MAVPDSEPSSGRFDSRLGRFILVRIIFREIFQMVTLDSLELKIVMRKMTK